MNVCMHVCMHVCMYASMHAWCMYMYNHVYILGYRTTATTKYIMHTAFTCLRQGLLYVHV